MGLKKFVNRMEADPGHTLVVQIICLGIFFALGMLIGYCYAVSCGEDGRGQLSAYLDSYCALFADGLFDRVSLPVVFRLYFFPLLLASLLGFTKMGAVLLPLLSAAYGFLMAFSVGCFFCVYGRVGVWPALAAFGPRVAVLVPVFLWCAAYSWSVVCGRLFVSGGKRCASVRRDGPYYYRLCLCVVLLMAGACAEHHLVPHLFRLAVSGL